MPPRADEPRDDADEPVADAGADAGADDTATRLPSAPEPAPGGASGHERDDRAMTYPVAPWVSDPRVIRPAGGRDATPPELAGRDWDGTGQIDDAEAAVDAEEH